MSKTAQYVIIGLLALVLVVVCALAAFFLVRDLTQPEQAADDSWQRVEDAGKIVVGTAADYPPFEYYANHAQIDGYDIALMNAIGQHLGLEIEYRNFAFDGLCGALQVSQIDAAIAAIAVTPEREAKVEFTTVYFVGEDGILASEESEIHAIGAVDELASSRVGVQRGSVYEGWLQSSLVDAELMPAGNLLSYDKIEGAVRDLRAGRLDLVVMDALPAQTFAAEGGVKVVAHGLNQQRFAIAVPKGAATLRAALDHALSVLHNEGVMAELAKEYLDLEAAELLPTPTPTPPPAATNTPGPTATFVDGMALVQHLSYEPQDPQAPPQMEPGQPFTKGWRVKNSGTCTWDTTYTLTYVPGNDPAARMGGEPLPITHLVAPGQTYDLEVDLVAPLKPGIYLGVWQMVNGGDQPFGERLEVGITVPAPPTATPAPTQTPSPGITFTVDRGQILAGECVAFSWGVEDARAVYFYAEGERWQDNAVAVQGLQQECPPVTTAFYLRVVKPDNQVDTRQITIYVEPAEDVPIINRFTVDPTDQFVVDQCVDIRWDVGGDVDKVTITADDVDLWEGAPLSGSMQNCPALPGTMIYGIEAVGPGGTGRQQESIQVVRPSAATPGPTGDPDSPVIYSFSANPNQIAVGDCASLSWSVGGATSMVRLLRDDAVLLEDTAADGQQMDCLDEPGDYVYRLVAFSLGGDSVSEEAPVKVTEGAPENPLAGTSWQATQLYDGTAMASVLDGTAVTAVFSQDGEVEGSAGCNTYSATYTVDGKALSVSSPEATNKTCADPPGIMEQETAYLAALGLAVSFRLEAGELYILDLSGQVLVEYVRVEQ